MSIWPTKRAPGSRTRSFCTCQGLRPRRDVWALAIPHPFVLPSAQLTASALGKTFFRGSMAGLCAPLPTLRRHPRGCLRTARGRCGSLLLHRSGLPPPTPCQSPGAPTVMLSRIAQLDQRTALPDQCLPSAEADVRPPGRKSGPRKGHRRQRAISWVHPELSCDTSLARADRPSVSASM